MRIAWLVVACLPGALAACGNDSREEACPFILVSDFGHEPGTISSGKHLIGVTWSRQFGANEPEHHGVMVFPDGTISPDVRVSAPPQFQQAPYARGVPGKTTILWQGNDRVYRVTLQRGGEVMHFDFAGSVRARNAIFDGQAYQVFWISSGDLPAEINGIYHRSISEDGVAGPIHELKAPGGTLMFSADIAAAGDGAGTTFLRMLEDAYILDTQTGMLTLIYDEAEPAKYGYRESFYFAGQFHFHQFNNSTPRLISCSTTSCTPRPLVGDLSSSERFFPGDTTMFVHATAGFVEVDTSFEIIRRFPFPMFDAGRLNDDLVRINRVPMDENTREPGFVELLGESTTSAWRRQLAVDSPVRTVETCGDVAQ